MLSLLFGLITFPFRLVFGLMGFIIGLAGKIVAIVLSLVVIMLGGVFTLTLVGAGFGIPLAIFGMVMLVGSIF